MKNLYHIIYGFAITTLLGGLVYQMLTKPVKTENNVAEIIKLENTKPTIYTDKSGNSHTQKEQTYLSKDYANLLLRKELDSIKIQMGVKDKQIVSLVTLKGEAVKYFEPIIITLRDSLQRVTSSNINYKSEYFDLEGSLYPEPAQLTAKFRDSLTLVFIKKKYGFLHTKEKILVDAHSANKDMIYKNLRSYAVPETTNNKAKFGLGITGGYGVQFSNNTLSYGPQITAGIQYRF